MSEGTYSCLRGPTGVSGHLLVPVGGYLYLRVPTAACGCLLWSDSTYWCLLVSERTYGYLLVCECAYCCLWVPAIECGCVLVSEGAYWYQRVPTDV